MRFHVVSLAHTQTTYDYEWCAYTAKVRKFCNMMMSLGHEVFLYASEDNQAQCTKLITCITKAEQKELGADKAEFVVGNPYWSLMNKRAAEKIGKHIEQKDFICLIAGLCQKEIADAYPNHMTVEFGIGYGGTFAKYRVFESYAWLHTVYGTQNPNAHAIDGNWWDIVIPNYFEEKKFPYNPNKEDYFLFIGRLIDRKGYHIAQEVCEKLGKRLIIAGGGEQKGYGEFVGVVGPKERGELMSKAQAVFVPTIYIEPFGGVAVEAMLCGTPVITTDWGAFTETVEHGVTGFRCHTFREFCEATEKVKELDPGLINTHALQYTTDNVKYKYEQYFERLLTLWNDGWYS
ncbi:glycosyltransferase [Polynucleobacter sp.]|uniref:glycosyltransferase n=1 Tax=Polynucleobacter sp. TaxID=2029855 RepID=UPI003F6A511A